MSDLREANGLVERIILRRLFEERLDGYTIETAEEIVAALSAQPHPKAVEADQIQRAMDMLGDVPGNTILERVERIVSYYLALQCELEKVRAVPPLAPDERVRRALERIAAFNDTHANEHLAKTGSYTNFDEPSAVKIAREALSGAADASNASAEARSFSYALERLKSGIPMHRLAWKLNKFIRVSKPLDASLDYLELAYTDGRCAPWTPTRCDLLENDWREFDAAPSRADGGKKSEGGVEGHAQCLTIDRQSSIGFGSCRSSVEAGIKPGPSDPTPAEQREAVARAIVEFARDGFTTIRLVRDVGPYEITEPTPAAFEFADAILALQTRAGG